MRSKKASNSKFSDNKLKEEVLVRLRVSGLREFSSLKNKPSKLELESVAEGEQDHASDRECSQQNIEGKILRSETL